MFAYVTNEHASGIILQMVSERMTGGDAELSDLLRCLNLCNPAMYSGSPNTTLEAVQIRTHFDHMF